MTRILVFDWTPGGHHEVYVARVVSALKPRFTPIVAGPSELLASMEASDVETFDLGPPRPRVDASRRLKRDVVAVANEETSLFRKAISASGASYALHLFADGIMRQLLRGPRLPAKVGVLLFRPRAHYPSLYETPLSPRARLLAAAYESVVWGWRQRPDAHAVLTLDKGAATRWARQRGARSVWLPEPPVLTQPPPDVPRRGAALFGSLGPRKGVDRLARAARLPGEALALTVAGSVVPGYEEELAALSAGLRTAGVDLDMRPQWHDEASVIRLFGGVRCVVLPYVNHLGMSRVLLEAAHSGTPVVAQDHGLLGYLVRTHGLGLSVNIESPHELRRAIDVLNHDDASWTSYHQASLAFAKRYGEPYFASSLDAAFPSPQGAGATLGVSR